MAEGTAPKLGFDIDTASLVQGQIAADKLKNSLLGLADATDKEADAARRSGETHRKEEDILRRTEDATRRKRDAVKGVTDAINQQTDAERRAIDVQRQREAALALVGQRSSVRMNREAFLGGVNAVSEDQARSSLATQRQAAQTALALQRAEEAARRKKQATEEMARAVGGAGNVMQTTSGVINGMQGALIGAGAAMHGPQGLIAGMNGISIAGARILPLFGGLGAASALFLGGTTALAGGVIGLNLALSGTQERFIMYEARLRNVYGSMTAAKQAFSAITDLADDNGVAIDATADAYLRLARNNEAIGLTRAQMVDLTSSVQMLGRVSGASSGELQSGLVQFSQALAAGRLNGDELRSIMENMPALAKAIADGLGVSVGQLRAMGAEGELTSEKIVGSLLGQLPKIREEFSRIPETSEVAFTRIANNWSVLVDAMADKMNSSGIITGMASAVGDLIGLAAQAVQPEPLDREAIASKIAELEAIVGKGRPEAGSVASIDQSKYQALQAFIAAEKELLALRGQMAEVERREADEAEAARLEREAQLRAPYVNAGSVLQEIEKKRKERTELENQLASLEKAIASVDVATGEGLQVFEPSELERIERMGVAAEVLRIKISQLTTVLGDYTNETAKMRGDRFEYGTGGAASFGEEVRKLQEKGLASGEVISRLDAFGAVTQRRILEAEDQTAALQRQIEAEERRIATLGMGTEATIEAEVAAEAYALQMKLFGKDLLPSAAQAMEEYTDQLRRLKEMQKEATDQQRLFNAELDLMDVTAINAAIAAGATPGEIARLRAEQAQARRIGEEAGYGASAPPIGPGAGAGTSTGEWLRYSNQGATRNQPLSPELIQAMSFLKDMGVQMEVFSGGQDATGPNRVGSHRHDHGNSADVFFSMDGRRLDWANPQDRPIFEQIVQQGRAAGVTGFGAGPGYMQQGSMHLGFGTPAVWGAGGSGEAAPDWLVRAYNGGGGAAAGTGMQAVQVEGQAAMEGLLTPGLQQLADLRYEFELNQRLRAAQDPVERREIERQNAADRAARGVDPSMRDEVYSAELAKREQEDADAQARTLETMRQQTQEQEKMLELSSLPPRQREIELRVLRAINDELQAGRAVSAETEQIIREQVRAQLENERAIESATDKADRFKEIWDSAAQGIGSSIEKALVNSMKKGRMEAEEILEALVIDITTSVLQAYVTKPLVSAIQDFLPFASGGAIDRSTGNVVPFATGAVFDSPRLFPMASGATGLMAEAGAEAILPLKRGSDGKLGVASSGQSQAAATTVIVNDMRAAEGSQQVEVQESTGPGGERVIEVLIRDEVRRQMSSGAFNSEMRSTYGIAPPVARR